MKTFKAAAHNEASLSFNEVKHNNRHFRDSACFAKPQSFFNIITQKDCLLTNLLVPSPGLGEK